MSSFNRRAKCSHVSAQKVTFATECHKTSSSHPRRRAALPTSAKVGRRITRNCRTTSFCPTLARIFSFDATRSRETFATFLPAETQPTSSIIARDASPAIAGSSLYDCRRRCSNVRATPRVRSSFEKRKERKRLYCKFGRETVRSRTCGSLSGCETVAESQRAQALKTHL